MNKAYFAPILLLLSACGGSSSGGANLAPEVTVVASHQYERLLLNEAFSLNASQSRDPEGGNLSYRWVVLTQPTGSFLAESSNSFYSLNPSIAGKYQLQLVVSDGSNSKVRDFDYQTITHRFLLEASNNSPLSATAQIEAIFGANSVELPQTHNAEHLTIEPDSLAGEHYKLTLHLEDDGDRATPLNLTDRQRNELKTFSGSASALRCSEGEKKALSWYFKADNLGLSTSFSHFFQIKGQNSHPLLTLTAKRTNGQEALRVNYGTSDQVLAEVDWAEVNNRWLSVNIVHGCGPSAGLSLEVTDLASGQKYLQVDNPSLDMWQGINGDVFGYKFGFYRKVKTNVNDVVFKSGLTPGASSVRVGNIRIESF